ncbi:predicted protein [Chaetoceros tenuissimus]|uniref:Uncharacterized protein n=1 Tax=Chaetoceros tenuissimus TaxID=426638 RepID=A0AAD3D0W3_9STRA|nr:predicted protein [Chaetoceros tenuissimus]
MHLLLGNKKRDLPRPSLVNLQLQASTNYLKFLEGNDLDNHDTDRQEKLWMIDLKKDSLSLEMNHLDKFTVSIAPLHHFEVRGTTVVHDEEGKTTFRVGEVIVVGKIYFDDRASSKDLYTDIGEDEDIEKEIWSVPEILKGNYPGFPKNFKLRVERIFIPTEIIKDHLVSVGI